MDGHAAYDRSLNEPRGGGSVARAVNDLSEARGPPLSVDAGTGDQLKRAGWIACALCVFQTYFVVAAAIPAHRALTLSSSLDRLIPLVPAWAYVYGAIYSVAVVPLFIVRDARVLRRVALGFMAINLLAGLVFLAFPTRMERPEWVGLPVGSFTQWSMGLIYALDPPVNCLPSLHVANAFYVGSVARSFDRRVGRFMFALAFLIAFSTLLVKQHYLLDVVSGALLGCGIARLAIPRTGWSQDTELPAWHSWLWIPGFYFLYFACAAVAYLAGWRPGMALL
jgi:membrane-associated phospholipid phosphatase